jgi:hypothetical protein
MAAFVPARRALSWQLTDASGTPVVRERYWLTFQPGEIRVCTSCHGLNDKDQAGHTAPTNPPQALSQLLQFWKTTSGCSAKPGAPALASPADGKSFSVQSILLKWKAATCAAPYRVIVRQGSTTGPRVVRQGGLTALQFTTPTLAKGQTYFWRVRACNPFGCASSAFRSFIIAP